ncbi:efflux RND transporter periplasmic adaptor subunit [Alkalilimnicola sp. S0819]|nr:efflux RND transporter periplasmic adaptor subunit [Alkalilimnicola sp. S0819]MPQ16553.1 efflux RND transporter periplasmic adaptor subunit [Alkalilimnicola sp. S0819]
MAVLMAALVVAVGFGAYRWWQGPQVQGYLVAQGPLVQTVVATGRVVPVSRAQLGSEIAGVVLQVLVREGDTVAPGEPLLRLDAGEIAAQVRQAEAALAELETSTRPQAELALARAETELAQARREAARRRALARESMVPREALEQAEQALTLARNALQTARLRLQALAPGNARERQLREQLAALRARLEKTVLRARVGGTVLTRDVEPGDLVQPGHVLFTLALGGGTEIRVPLDERNLARLALHQPATVIADAYPAQPFPARLAFIAPGIDPQRGTVEVRLAVDPAPDFLRQDMTVSVNIETGRREQALVVPNDALDEEQIGRARVWLLREGRVRRRVVTLGLRGLAMSEVLAGLRAGDRVLADGAAALAEGARVRFSERAPPAGGEDERASRNELPVSFN